MIREDEDAFVISAPDLVVAACRHDSWSWRLELRSDAQDITWTLTIAVPVSVTQTRSEVPGLTHSLERLAGKSISDVRARKSDGGLEIRFDDGELLRVEPDPDYEAWEMYSTRGERLIAVPGDGVAKWGEIIGH